MELLKLFLTFNVFTAVILYIQAAPTSEPPRTLEHDTDVNPELANRDSHDVITNERFYRVNEDGSIEFKTALSNGHIQYQRITNKIVDGKTIQVYEGYTSQRYADGRYGTTYYIADENGYRRTKVETDINPPTLPSSGPYPPELTKTNKPEYELGNRILDVGRSVPPKPIGDGQLTNEEELEHPKGVKRGTDLESKFSNGEEENLNKVLPGNGNEVTTEILADDEVSKETPNTHVEEENFNHSVTEQNVAKNPENNHEKTLITTNGKIGLMTNFPAMSEENKANLVQEHRSALGVSNSGKNVSNGDVPTEENLTTVIGLSKENLNNLQVFDSDQATKVSIPSTTENNFSELEENKVNILLPAEDKELTNTNDEPIAEENMSTVTEEPIAEDFEKDFITSTMPPYEENVTDEEPAGATENVNSIIDLEESSVPKLVEHESNKDSPIATEKTPDFWSTTTDRHNQLVLPIAKQTEQLSDAGTIRTKEYKSVDKFTEIPITTDQAETENPKDDDISTFTADDVTKKTPTLLEEYQNVITTIQTDIIGDDNIVITELPPLLLTAGINGRGFEVSTTVQPTYTHEYDYTASKENNSNGIQGTYHEDAVDNETTAPLDSPVTESSQDKSLEEVSADIANTELSLGEEDNTSTEAPAFVPTKLNETKILEKDLIALEVFNNISNESTENKTSQDNQNEEESTEQSQSSVNHKFTYAEYLANDDEVAPPTTTEEIEHKTGEGDESNASVIRI